MTNVSKILIALAGVSVLACASPAASAEKKAEPEKPAAAREVFGRIKQAIPMEARSIGGYARGCLAGGKMLPVNGPAWQAMRLSRNRNWGHPLLVKYVERLAVDAQKLDGWPGLLVGDMAQPAGGPMLTGHASHQIGLDVDIWLKPMPPRELTAEERENISADSMLGDDKLSINAKLWTPGHVKLLRRAALYPAVARIFVHPVIKKALCQAAGQDRGWLSKVRPWWGHHYHFHVRLQCPAGEPGCQNQPAAGNDDGCGAELDNWFKLLTRPPDPNSKPQKPKPPLTLADLPAACGKLVTASATGKPVALDVEEQPQDTAVQPD
jgi:penicillin-insensitive murein endopeptidase